MVNYDYQIKLQKVWEHGVKAYREGAKSADSMFDDHQEQFLASIGQTTQEMFDYCEDYASGSEPGFGDVAAVAYVRRAYFLQVQHGGKSQNQLDPDTLPSKQDELYGVVWMPRIIVKAHAKLRGELHPNIMYGCGGDRRFLREHDIHPADLLSAVWRLENDTEAIAKWILQQSKVVSAEA